MKKVLAMAALCVLLTVGAARAGTEVTFEWTPRPEAEAVVGYNIYRSDNGNTDWSKVNSELITASEYTYKVPSGKETESWYYCTAKGAAGAESLPSNVVHLLPPVAGFKYVIRLEVIIDGSQN